MAALPAQTASPCGHARGLPRRRTAGWEGARSAPSGRGFTLLELVMVVVVIGTIGAIAVPRMVSASENAKATSLDASRVVFQKALDLYVEEHTGLSANQEADGSATNNQTTFVLRLTGPTDANGNPDAAGLYGPYLRAIPANSFASTRGVRLAGGTTARDYEWYFDTATNTIMPDQTRAVALPGGKGGKVGIASPGLGDQTTPDVGGQLPIDLQMVN